MIHLEKIDYRNIWDIVRLSVAESQKEFVADNWITFFGCLVTKLFTEAGVDLCLDLLLSVRVFRITPGGYAHVFHNPTKAGIIEI